MKSIYDEPIEYENDDYGNGMSPVENDEFSRINLLQLLRDTDKQIAELRGALHKNKDDAELKEMLAAAKQTRQEIKEMIETAE